MGAAIDAKVIEATAMVCTEETVKAVKKMRADLNAQFNTLEEQGKAVKAAVMEPYLAFEAVYKDHVTSKFNAADQDLKQKINQTEDGLKDEKFGELLEYFVEYTHLKLILLTHLHSDHFNRATIKKLASERPLLRFGCCEWLVGTLVALGVSCAKIDVYEIGKWCEYGGIKVSPVGLFHDVPNCGYRVEVGGEKVLYATDTGSMCSVDAVGYDLYMIEANYTEAEIQERIERKLQAGEFVYEYRAAVGHLSKEQADAFLAVNAREQSEILYLHQHESEG